MKGWSLVWRATNRNDGGTRGARRGIVKVLMELFGMKILDELQQLAVLPTNNEAEDHLSLLSSLFFFFFTDVMSLKLGKRNMCRKLSIANNGRSACDLPRC